MKDSRPAHATTNSTALRFWIEPPDEAPYEVDLSEFAFGKSRDSVVARARSSWAGDYNGRAELAEEISGLIREGTPSKRTFRTIVYVARCLYRFLDRHDDTYDIYSSRDFVDFHGLTIQNWLSEQGQRNVYGALKTLIFTMRSRAGHPGLLWPSKIRRRVTHKEDIDLVGMKRLYLALKKEGADIKRMFREGEALVRAGNDPRGRARVAGTASWHARENHAWLIEHLNHDRLLTTKEIALLGRRGLSNLTGVPGTQHNGPSYIAPGMTSRGSRGIGGKLRWFHPGYQDTAVFLWLFLLGTGWNLSTALAVDLSVDWSEPHPQKAGYRIIHAFKRRSGRHQFTVSMERPEWHPYQILMYMQERTATLRRTVQHQLEDLQKRAGPTPSIENTSEIERLKAVCKSPWLYHSIQNICEVHCFDNNDTTHINNIARHTIERHRLGERHPTLKNISTSEARDAWIGHAHASSGGNILITYFAAQHSDFRNLELYLRRRRYRAQGEQVLQAFQHALFEEINERGVLDPTRLRIRVQEGTISHEQEQRLLDHRKRTRLGMGCLDPTNPPPNVAPRHREGSLCRVQRCTGCQHGFVFAESLEPLARAHAELIFLKRTMPLSSWINSSLHDEEVSIRETLRNFDTAAVDDIVNSWLSKLVAGEIVAHDTYPIY